MKRHVLLTGVTGFVGKVVLFELLRRREELGIERVTVLIRGKKRSNGEVRTPRERFVEDVAPAALFRSLPADWRQSVDIVGADLERPGLGLAASDEAALVSRVTHVLHCAASVEFDLPIAAAKAANIDAALNMLELARRCSRLVSMVSVSTAYVSVWRNGPIGETLGHLPRAAADIVKIIEDGSVSEAELLAESGHPNTYTYTKCVVEHLLSERRGDVPLTIVRPSIISAAWSQPVPGWIDSRAAFAGCLLATGLGFVKAWEANPNVRLDVVPVDVVARGVIDAGFLGELPAPGERTPIRLLAMGLTHAMRADLSTGATARFFEERPGAKFAPGCFIGGEHHGFLKEDMKRRALPSQVLRTYFSLTRQPVRKKQVAMLDERVQRMNAAFSYFIHHSFDFRPSRSVVPQGFSPARYIDIVNRGMYKHLLRRDESELTLAGRRHESIEGDLRWALNRRDGNGVIRAFGYSLRKVLRRCTSAVTFDRASFERAVASVPADHAFVLAPSHRSYFDFLLSCYLCFQHPELGIPVPRIAAAEEFAKIPLVGGLLSRAGAFYVRRGVGKAVPEVRRELERALGGENSLMFFIEGQRSRGRHVLAPKRGLLRALQETGRSFAVLPIAISYERVPEEGAFERELRGGRRSAMSVEAIVRWLVHLAGKRVQLGRVHIACGRPLLLEPGTRVQGLASDVAAALQQETVVTSFHLRSFLALRLAAGDELGGVDEAWLRAAIGRRGGRVLDSDTPLPNEPSTPLSHSLQNQWMHWFYADALELFPDNRVVRDHVARHGWTQREPAADVHDPRVRALVQALFHPVIAAYDLVTQHVHDATPELTATSPATVAQQHPGLYLPHLEDAFRALSEHGLLSEISPGSYAPVAALSKDAAWGSLAQKAGQAS
jgi:thioester reductase-like protein/1-acyl-sn-glycerol-3-phosphate acyltransferase